MSEQPESNSAECAESPAAAHTTAHPNGPIGPQSAAAELIDSAPDPSTSSGFTPGLGEDGNAEKATGAESFASEVDEWRRDLKTVGQLAQNVLQPRGSEWAPTTEEIEMLADGLAPVCAKYLGSQSSPEVIALLAVGGYVLPRLIPKLPALSATPRHGEEEEEGEAESFDSSRIYSETLDQ